VGRQGRDTTAQTIFRQRLGFEVMTAEDSVIAAAGLLRQGQTNQARIALEKARGQAPDHPEMLHDLARLDVATDHRAEAAELSEGLPENYKVRIEERFQVLEYPQSTNDR
jgi:hypothetical protein